MDWRNAFIIGWIGTQMLLPLAYYVPGGREPSQLPGVDPLTARFDERWAWRMFSDVRMLKCKAEYARAGRTIDLEREVHMAWGSLLPRGRPDVLDDVAERLCEAGGPVTLKMVCRNPDGTFVTVSPGAEDVCGAFDGP